MTALLDALTAVPRSLIVGDITDRRPDATELEMLATGRAYSYRKGGRELVVAALRGGSVGAGAVYARNLPTPGTYVIDPVSFAVLTQRNEKTYPSIAWPGYSQKINQTIDKTGIVGNLLLVFDGTSTAGATAGTVNAAYPWNLVSRVKVSANGISNLFYADGYDLRALARVRHGFFNDRESTFTLPGNSAAKTLRLAWEIPLPFDDSLVGAVFAQTEDTELVVEVETCASADIWAANANTITGNFYLVAEFFSLPYQDSQQGRKIVLPDIRQLHGFIAKDDAITGTGEHTAELMRTGGILLRVLQRADNAPPTAIGALDLGTYVANHKFRYGSNVIPTDKNGWIARYLEETSKGDKLMPAADVDASTTAVPQYIVDDYVRVNTVRDVIHLLGVTTPQMLNQIASTATINTGAKMHTVQEHMVAG